jgi:hypothetical protein
MNIHQAKIPHITSGGNLAIGSGKRPDTRVVDFRDLQTRQ